jgi:hypothetical protein
MRSIHSLFVCVIALTFIISSCKKDKETVPSKTALLTAKAWKLDKVLLFNTEVTDPNILATIGGLANSEVKFNADGTYTATDRTTNTKTNGTWEFNSDQTKLTVKGSTTGSDVTFDIKTLTDKNMDLFTQQAITGYPISVPIDIKLIPA